MTRKFISPIILICLLSAVSLAGPQKGQPNTAVINSYTQAKTQSNIRKTQEFQDLKDALQAYGDDRVVYTNALAKYDPDYTTATNKIALVSDAPTKLALTKVLAVIDDVQTALKKNDNMDADTKKAVAAAKAVMVYMSNLSIDPAVLNQ